MASLGKVIKTAPRFFGGLLVGLLAMGLGLAQESGYWKIGVNDFTDFAGLARRLQLQQDEPSKCIYKALGGETKTLLEKTGDFAYSLDRGDIKNEAGLLRSLRIGDDPVSAYLFRKLTPETQNLLIREGGAFSPSPELTDALYKELNDLLRPASLYDEAVFRRVVLSPETQKLLAARPEGAEVVKLNRLLLENAYPAEIRKSADELAQLNSDLRFKLREDLNAIIHSGRSLYEAGCFKGVELSAETAELAAQKPSGDQLVRLNRLLLEDACPNEIAKSHTLVLPKDPATPPVTPPPTPTPAPRVGQPVATPAPLPQPTPVNNEPVTFAEALKRRNITLPEDCADELGQRILAEYGAVFVAQGAVPPPRCVFHNEAEVKQFQGQPQLSRSTMWRGVFIKLQARAFYDFGQAYNEAARLGLRITLRGPDAAARSYAETLKFWNSRFLPGLTYWTRRGKISAQEATRIRALPIREQVLEVLKLEAKGVYFSKDLSKSILYSVAAPGSSQHLAMLALDINEFANPRVRAILAQYGWFQTVKSDAPHFTYIGVPETDLPALGLRLETIGGQRFWIPALEEAK